MMPRMFLRLVFPLIISSGLLLSACGSDEFVTPTEIGDPTIKPPVRLTTVPSNAADSTEMNSVQPGPDQPAPVIAESPTQAPQPLPLPTVPPGAPFGDEDARNLMAELSTSDQASVDEALSSILEAGDTRFIAPLIEIMRGRQLGIVGGNYNVYVEALENLSGQRFGSDWPAWVEWYGKSELQPPPGFTGWKGLLLGRIDPGFDDFLQDEHPSRIRVEEIQWGGVPIDGIPPLESAPTLPGLEADYLEDDEPVFGLTVNGDSRAYPLRIIDNHEMANDVIGGVPVSLAYCTLCGAAIAYDGRGPDGEVYDFGTSGFLYRSNKLMYDRQTRTLWNQLTGEPVLGELAGVDLRLEILPLVLTSWADWLAQHPDTLVLDRDTGYYPPEIYVPGVFYGDYFASSDTMFPVWQRSGLLPPKEFVYTLHLNGEPKAYQIDALANDRVLNDSLGNIPVVLIADRGAVAVNGRHQILGEVTYDVGGEVRAFDRGDEVFTPGEEPGTVLDAAGNPWQVTEEGLVGPDGVIAPRIAGHLAYWFGWYAFFPNTQLYSSSSSGSD
jgi:hypothetical protein